MGEPAPPTQQQRLKRFRLARDIVESVRNDETMPLRLSVGIGQDRRTKVVALADVEQLVFDLAQELVLLTDELAQVDSCLDDWNWEGLAGDTKFGLIDADALVSPLECIARIEAARKGSRRG